ncbi:MAG: hypothetical protein MR900_07775 [Prevotella sp.]|nr:hypothetical protein [Prevotella sp.]
MEIAVILTTTVFDFGHVHQSVDTYRLTVQPGRHNAVDLRYCLPSQYHEPVGAVMASLSDDGQTLTVCGPRGRHGVLVAGRHDIYRSAEIPLSYASCSIVVAQSDDADALVRQHTV